MYHFFVEEGQVGEKTIQIMGTDVNHIKNVLRMKVGEEILVSTKSGVDYRGALESLESEFVEVKILEQLEETRELPNKIYLFQGLPKSDKMEWIIQKTVELGVTEIIPVSMKRCVVKLDAKKEDSKNKRWNSISESAAKQSKRSVIPEVKKSLSYLEALKQAMELDHIILPYEAAEDMKATRTVFERIKPGESIGIFIGPEGGFEESEIEKAVEAGAKAITLGKRILRTETAGIATLSMLTYVLE